MAVCPGSGANDGLTYVFQHVFDGPEDIGNGSSFHGVIYEGPPPPLGPLPVESPPANE